jgi:hypothetical protein
MKYIDVFNGDADGICALHQMRLSKPVDSQLVTGVKRDISLLKKVQANAGDQLLVLDISLDKNRNELLPLLEQQVKVEYFDHHFSGEIPQNPGLTAHIDTDPNTCTSLLVNQHLNSQYLAWAVTAAFGDNLHTSARTAAQPLNLNQDQLAALELLGTCINYNGYGASLDDLIFTPDALYNKIKPYADPFDFIASDKNYQTLVDGYQQDLARAEACQADYQSTSHSLSVLPDEKWARRVSGVYANALATANPDRAHAMLTRQGNDSFLVSVRAPLNNKTGADELCRQFDTGGGRKAAAGINHLPVSDYDRFLQKFTEAF